MPLDTALDAATTQPALDLNHIPTSQHTLDVLRQGLAQTDILRLCREMNPAVSVILVAAGIIFLMWGFYAFKSLVTLNAAVMGAWLGTLAGHQAGGALPAACIGAFVGATVAWPLMKYAVAVMGGVIGTVIGMCVWRSAGLDPAFAAAGGGMGLIFFGMLSFILFRTSVMMFTSLQGSFMLIFGILGLIFKITAIDTHVIDKHLAATPLIMPIVVVFAAVVGLLYQNQQGLQQAEVAKK